MLIRGWQKEQPVFIRKKTENAMTLDIATHKTILFQILKDIYADTSISPYIGFKGGTAALMFYGLDRFSVDLDFDLLDESQADYVFERVLKSVEKYGMLKEAHKKRFNLFIMISYDDRARNIKIEINLRAFGSQYEIKSYLGVSMQVMVLEDMFAHKLMAMHERMGVTARDIYDVWYFLTSRAPINKPLVESRSGMAFENLVQKCIDQLGKVDNKQILVGLGELINPRQKDWVRANLREEVIALLKMRL
jgi:predicted nucleotidyltransferase component of viral defense system